MKRFLSLLLWGVGCLAAAPITFQVTVNTAGFVGQDARADFQFNPSGFADAAVLVTDSLSGVGSVTEASRAGDVTGTGPWTFGNSQANNQLVLNLLNLSTSFQFFITFSGDAVDNPTSFDTTSFFFTLLDSTGAAPLTGFNAPSLWLEVAGGQVLVTSQDQPIQLDPVVVPEPATMAMLAVGLGVLGLLRRR